MEIHGVRGRVSLPAGGARATGGALHGGGAAQEGFIREFEGSWTVSEEPGGGVRVRHTLALRPALTPPYAHKIFLRQIREILQDVQNEVERWDGQPYPASASAETDRAAIPVAR